MDLSRLWLCSSIIGIIPTLLECSVRNQLPANQVSLEVAQLLDSIYVLDQHYRQQYEPTLMAHGHSSSEIKLLASTINKIDSSNLVQVRAILNQYGWLGPETVGETGNAAIFLVIQHSDKNTRKQYLPMMRKAVRIGKAAAADLAQLEDRVALDEGNKQIYGTQLRFDKQEKKYKLLPLEDPSNVGARREKVGLIPMSEFLKQWGITDWNPESEAH